MNSHTKKEFLSYLDKLHKNTDYPKIRDSKVRQDILSRLEKACDIVDLSFAELLNGLDFKPNDLTIEALESFLAQLRAIFWLRDFGFSEIAPLKAKKKTEQADFKSKYKNRNSTIEVFCLTQKHGQQRDPHLGVFVNFDPNFKGSKFGRDFMTVAQRKKEQLDSSPADIKVLLCVVNSEPMVALNTKEDFDRHAKLLYGKLSWGRGYYIGILTDAKPNGISSDTIFPKLG